jgi:O-antigen/teichoic acid export membrane protein
MISFAIVIPYIFNFFFDTQWNDAGKYAQLLSPWYFIVLLTSSVSGVLVVKQQQKDALVLEILALLFRLLAIYFGTILWNPFTGILLFSMIGFIYNIVLLFKYYTYASSDL